MLLKKRILAALLDYIVILVYGFALFGITITLFPLDQLSQINNPTNGQLVGFLSLTAPVFLYFYIMESSKYRASLGKLALKIQVNSESGSVFKRNLLKFLPWEIAHFGAHWMFYYNSQHINVPFWLWLVLILPQFTALLYFISIVYTKGKSSLYDRFAHTHIQNRK